MKNKYPFNKVTCAILGMLTVASFSGQAAAEESKNQNDVEVIEVTGIRGSLVKSMNNKRFSNNIVDTISAEDIGKFPDSNIAESLQRITGVSIDRSGGEGRFVSIRGMGPGFTSTTLNGREIASESSGRAFGFDTLAAELVSSIDVHKTSKAQHLEGGVGGLIDIKTAKPFDYEGFHAAGSFEFVKEKNEGDVTPQAGFLISNTFMDDKLGLLASVTYQNRKTESYFAANDGILTRSASQREHGRPTVRRENRDDLYYYQNFNQGVDKGERERIGGNLVAQYAASDDLVFTVDYLYSKLDVESVKNQVGTWFWANHSFVTAPEDEGKARKTVVQQIHADEFTSINGGYTSDFRPATTQMLGLNAEWQLSDTLSLNADVSWSKAVNDNKGLNERLDVGYLRTPGLTLDYTSGQIPSLIHHQPEVTAITEENITNYVPRHTERFGNYARGENKQAKFDFQWQLDAGSLTSVDFGYHFVSKAKANDRYLTGAPLTKVYQHLGAKGLHLNSDVLSIADYGNVFPSNTPAGRMYEIDRDAYWAQILSPESLAFVAQERPSDYAAYLELQAAGIGWDAQKSDDSFEIEEKIHSLYIDANFEGEINDMSWNVVTGVRYSKTAQDSIGTFRTLTHLTAAIDEITGDEKDNLLPTYSGATPGVVDNNYDNFLPSISGNLHITDELIFRAGASETMTRPILTDLAPSFNLGGTTKLIRTAKGSNPHLKPFKSTNFDLSLEWYYDEASLLSIAYFSKTIDDFIIKQKGIETFDVEIVSVEAGKEAWKEFDVSRPQNGEQAKVDGVEINWTHAFDNGFGFQINATFADSNADFDSSDPEASEVFALEGLSDSSNIVAFYENGPIQLRAAYNMRDKFLETQVGLDGEPVFVRDYDQLDISGSYDIDDNFSVYFEAVNVTDSDIQKQGRFSNHFISWANYGPHYAVGVRAAF